MDSVVRDPDRLGAESRQHRDQKQDLHEDEAAAGLRLGEALGREEPPAQEEQHADQDGHTGEIAAEAHQPEADSSFEDRHSQKAQREEGVSQDQNHRPEEHQGVGGAGDGPPEES